MITIISLPKGASIGFIVTGIDMNEVISSCLPLRQLMFSYFSKVALLWLGIRTCDPPFATQRTYHYTTPHPTKYMARIIRERTLNRSSITFSRPEPHPPSLSHLSLLRSLSLYMYVAVCLNVSLCVSLFVSVALCVSFSLRIYLSLFLFV